MDSDHIKELHYVGETEEVNNTHFIGNGTKSPSLPLDMRFNNGHFISVVVYMFLFFVSAFANLSVFRSLYRIAKRRSLNRVNLLLLHLNIADMLVTFIMIPIEIAWNLTVSWKSGDLMCRGTSFCRTFGIYLSGLIVACISVDRYNTVCKALPIPIADSRAKFMLIFAWFVSCVASIPQLFVFRLQAHPVFTEYKQCITFNNFPSPALELTYNLFGFCVMYVFPLVMILFCYTAIAVDVFKLRRLRQRCSETNEGLRKSLNASEKRTLKMTFWIVGSFSIFWLPYNVITLWYFVDKASAQLLPPALQKILFLFACTNSCVNPFIYGAYHMKNFRR